MKYLIFSVQPCVEAGYVAFVISLICAHESLTLSGVKVSVGIKAFPDDLCHLYLPTKPPAASKTPPLSEQSS